MARYRFWRIPAGSARPAVSSYLSAAVVVAVLACGQLRQYPFRVGQFVRTSGRRVWASRRMRVMRGEIRRRATLNKPRFLWP